MSGIPIRTLQYYFNGPPTQGIVIKQRGNNGVQTCTAPAPNQQYPTDQTGNVANARASFVNAQKNFSTDPLYPSTSKIGLMSNDQKKYQCEASGSDFYTQCSGHLYEGNRQSDH